MNTHNSNKRPLRPLASLALGLIAVAGLSSLSCSPAHAAEAEPGLLEQYGLTYADPDTVREAVYRMEHAYERVTDYTATFYKRERVRGRLLPMEIMEIKFRKPFAVYLKWIGKRHQGQESLYVKGWNNNKLMAHPGSFPDVTVSLSPSSSLAMRGNRHDITECGIGKIIELIAHDMRRSESNPNHDVRFIDHGYTRIYGARSRCVEAIMPEDAGYYGHRAKICMDTKTELPNRVQIWNHDNDLVEDYGFKNLQVNPGLTSHDFDPENSDYSF